MGQMAGWRVGESVSGYQCVSDWMNGRVGGWVGE